MDEALVPSDTYFAIESLSEECVQLDYACAVLKTQIYTLVPDRAKVERELDALRCSGHVRLFQLRNERGDVAVLQSQEHVTDVESIARSRPHHEAALLQQHDAGIDAPELTVRVYRFRECVLEDSTESVISKSGLSKRMGTSEDPAGELEMIRLLQSVGFLLDHIRPNGDRSEGFELWSPRLRFLVSSLADGRKELLRMFGRKKYKEFAETHLLRTKLKKSRLGILYHLRDLMGLGCIRELQMPSGKFYRLVSDTI